MADNKRLIDANYLRGKLIHNCPIENGGIPIKDFDTHQKILELYPTVDAVEVVHGEWIVCGDGEYVPFMCSACGKTTSWYHAQTANYCPNCGAKMDLEVSDGKA